MPATRSYGKSPDSSYPAARGATSSRANSRTVLRIWRCSSLSSKFIGATVARSMHRCAVSQHGLSQRCLNASSGCLSKASDDVLDTTNHTGGN